MLNGFYHSGQEKLTTLDNGIIFGSLSAAAMVYPDLVKEYYSKSADFNTQPLTALNTVFAQDGVFIYVPKNTRSDKPFQIINLLHSHENILDNHRNLFILEENSNLDIVICDHTLNATSFLTNSLTEILRRTEFRARHHQDAEPA